MTEDNSKEENAFDKVKKGVKEVVGGTAGVVEGTAQGIKQAVEDTKEGVEETAEEVKEGVEDTHTYTKSYDQTENREYDKAGGNEPMNPEDIASHEPTAVKRDKNQGTSGDPV